MDGKYILNAQGEAVACDDVFAWGRWFEIANRRIAVWEEPTHNVLVSTVFLGLDHNYTRTGPPILWETLVMGGQLDGEMQRYSSRATAVHGHAAMVARVQQTLTTRHITTEDE